MKRKGDRESIGRKRKRWLDNRWRNEARRREETSISGVVIFSMGGEREREIVRRELTKNNETGTKVGTDRKGREEERSVRGRDDGETRELVPEKKKGHKGFAFIGHALHVGHTVPSLFLPPHSPRTPFLHG